MQYYGALRRLDTRAFDGLYDRMEQDFPAIERPPREALRALLRRGSTQAWVMVDAQEEACGYAWCGVAGRAVLVTHLAVHQGMRGHGIGTALLTLLAAQYAEMDRLIVEVERPCDGRILHERQVRERRIAYYERSGFLCYRALAYTIWHVPMHLMVKPLGTASMPTEAQLMRDVRAAYAILLPPHAQHMVEF